MFRRRQKQYDAGCHIFLQVATLSVYAYFTAALFGRQFLEPRGEHKSVFETPVTVTVSRSVIFKLKLILCFPYSR